MHPATTWYELVHERKKCQPREIAIENCDLRECPRLWDRLAPKAPQNAFEQSDIIVCAKCQCQVYRVNSARQIEEVYQTAGPTTPVKVAFSTYEVNRPPVPSRGGVDYLD